jgi:hypothetical protein
LGQYGCFAIITFYLGTGYNARKGNHDMPAHPEIRVDIDLAGDDGSQFIVLARVLAALRKNEVPEKTVQNFRAQVAACQDYNAMLAVVGKWVTFNDGIFENCDKWIR